MSSVQAWVRNGLLTRILLTMFLHKEVQVTLQCLLSQLNSGSCKYVYLSEDKNKDCHIHLMWHLSTWINLKMPAWLTTWGFVGSSNRFCCWQKMTLKKMTHHLETCPFQVSETRSFNAVYSADCSTCLKALCLPWFSCPRHYTQEAFHNDLSFIVHTDQSLRIHRSICPCCFHSKVSKGLSHLQWKAAWGIIWFLRG